VEAVPVPVVVAVRAVWDRLAMCESSGDWHNVNVGRTYAYYGGLQQDLVFWRRYGGTVYASRPDLASREVQVLVAERGLAVQGWQAWPRCSRMLGLR
jgi:resuscitation-promoting factor RpfA